MVGGLGVVALSLVVGWGVYERSRSLGEWDAWTASLGRRIASSAVVGAALASVVPTLFRGVQQSRGVSLHQFILFGASVGSGIRVLISAPPKLRISWTTPILLLHPIAFLSNSYTFWEDRAIPFFLLFTLVPALLTALSAPTTRLRYRILAFSGLFAACVRLMAISTVCREEQQPWCSVTFFSGSGAAETPIFIRVLLIPAAVLVPYGVRRVLAISKSDNGIASLLLPYVIPPALIAGSTCWLLESLDSSGAYQYPGYIDLRQARTILAWTSVLATLGGAALWALVPVALHVSSERTPAGAGRKTEVRVLGFANAYGAPFAVLWTLVLALVWLAAQPSGQITLALATAAVLAHLELVDAARDARALQASFSIDPAGALARLQQGLPATEAEQAQGATAVTVDEMVPLALLAQLVFFASGHQATFVSLQWKAAFVLTPTVSYPLSPLFVILNTLGPTALIAIAVPLLGTWNVAPLAVVPDTTSSPPGPGRRPASSQETQQQPTSQARVAVLAAVRAALGLSQYFGALLLGSALSAAWLRRHLMVWKVFAPRYMLGAVELLCVDVAVLGGLWLGVGRVVTRITRMFALPAPGASASPGSGTAEGQRS
jgi:phosphatidylinositol glycan class O